MTGSIPAHRALRLVLVTVFIDLIGFAIVLPLLPGYGARFGASDTAIGVLVASYSFMQLLVAPWWGRLSDRIGRRPVLLMSLVGSAVSYLMFGLAQSFGVLLLSRLVAGGSGAIVNVSQATLADITPPRERARAMGMIGAAFGVAFIIGPALGGVSTRFGDAAPGFLAAALSGSNFLVAVFRLPETGRERRPRATLGRVKWALLAVPMAIMFFETFGFTVMYAIFPLHAERALGFDREGVSYLFVFIGLVTAIVQGGLVGKLAPRFGEPRLMLVGSIVLAAGLALVPRLGGGGGADLFLLLGVLALIATGTGLVAPSAASLVSRLAGQELQGQALGGLQSVASMARVVGPTLLGGVSDLAPAEGPFLTAAGMAIVAAGFAVGAVRTASLALRRSGPSAHRSETATDASSSDRS